MDSRPTPIDNKAHRPQVRSNGLPSWATASGSIIQRRAIVVEHIRIDSNRCYDDVQAALEYFHNSIIEFAIFYEMARSIASEASCGRSRATPNCIIFSIAAHGDWLQIISGKRKAAQYVIGDVLVSTQMTRHRLQRAS